MAGAWIMLGFCRVQFSHVYATRCLLRFLLLSHAPQLQDGRSYTWEQLRAFYVPWYGLVIELRCFAAQSGLGLEWRCMHCDDLETMFAP